MENKKTNQLLKIQNWLESEFDIPALYDSDFWKDNQELMEVYLLVSQLKFNLMED